MKPDISLNLALSADGKISDAWSRPSGWTSPIDHARLLELRRGADALLVGHRTWLADRMTLCVPGTACQPLRCVVTRRGELDPAHPMFTTAGGDIHILCTEFVPRARHPEQVRFHAGSLASFLSTLYETHQVRRLHCEGGGTLVRELLRLDAVDTLHLTIAGHTIFGGTASPTATGFPTPEFLNMSAQFSLDSFEPNPTTGECFLTYRRIRPAN